MFDAHIPCFPLASQSIWTPKAAYITLNYEIVSLRMVLVSALLSFYGQILGIQLGTLHPPYTAVTVCRNNAKKKVLSLEPRTFHKSNINLVCKVAGMTINSTSNAAFPVESHGTSDEPQVSFRPLLLPSFKPE